MHDYNLHFYTLNSFPEELRHPSRYQNVWTRMELEGNEMTHTPQRSPITNADPIDNMKLFRDYLKYNIH